ncbi:MAG: aldose 1-epimerase family protein [Methylovirgula sp.]
MIVIRSGATAVSIARQGAEIMTWEVNGRPLLWEMRPEIWPETAPLLFPVVGWTRNGEVRVEGKTYPLALHGFARQREFRLVAQQVDRARFELASDTATRRLYPFDFTLIVEYAVGEGSISTVLTVVNAGDRPMPYACGLHPGFRWPFAGGAATDYRLRFAMLENPVIPRIAPGGLIARATRELPLAGAVLPLAPSLFENDALCFLNAASPSLRFEAPDGAVIAIEGEDFPHWGVWCRPGNGYLCIEQWTGFGDPEDFTGDLFSKPSMRILPPGAAARHAAHYRYKAAP